REAVAGIRDETVRRFYRDDIEERLRGLSGGQAREFSGGRSGGSAGGRAAGPRGAPFQRRPRPGDPPPSPRITTGFNPLLKTAAPVPAAGGRAAKREAMIVMSLLAHPELLGIEEEALAALELVNPDASALRTLLLDRAAEAGTPEPELLEARLRRAGLEEAHARLLGLVNPGDRWMLDPNADPQRLEHTLHQAVILHRQAGALHSELHQAERALAEDGSEANFAWLCDVQQQLAVIAAAEAEAEVSQDE
ncbi:DNA primase, partial [Methylorubrum rhodesianum]